MTASKLRSIPHRVPSAPSSSGRVVLQAMLAKKWLDYSDRFLDGKTSLYCSPKLDGIRCVGMTHGLYSRNKKRFQSCSHVHEEIVRVLKAMRGDYALDGELYIDKGDLDGACFERIVSAVKTTHEHATHEDYALQRRVRYHVFDLIDVNHPSRMPFAERLEMLKEYVPKGGIVKAVPYHKFCTQEQLDDHLEMYLEQGMEGLVIRPPQGLYMPGKRTMDVLKYVPTMEEEFDIFDTTEGKGKFAGTLGALTCVTKKGKMFQVNPGVADSVRLQWWKDRHKLIGKKATVKFQRYTEAGVPRFGSAKSIRNFMKMRV